MTRQRLLLPRANPSHAGRTPATSERAAAAWAVVGALLLGACDTSEGDETTAGTTTTGPTSDTEQGPPSGSTDTGSDTSTDPSADSGSDTTDPPPPNDACQVPVELPPAPVDCAGARGVIDHDVFIDPQGSDPSVLEGIRRIEGSLSISGIAGTDLAFMACLQEVTGDVKIFDNDQLTDVSGLWSLTTIGTDFIFSDNDGITTFDGLPNATVVPRNVVMKNNALLQAITGFHQLEEVGDNLIIQQNNSLLHVDGLGRLRTVGGVFAITANPQLCISSVNCVGLGITDPAVPPPSWSTQANDFGC